MHTIALEVLRNRSQRIRISLETLITLLPTLGLPVIPPCNDVA